MTDADLTSYCTDLGRRARGASRALATVRTAAKNAWLHRAADDLLDRQAEVLAANERDVAAAPDYGLTSTMTDRLRLTPARLKAAADGLREVAALPDPVGRVLEGGVRPNGLRIAKVGVPLGVIFFLYESRPNVTVDAAAVAVKSGNALILRGGKEAKHSNVALHRILSDALVTAGLPAEAVQLVGTTERAAVGHLLKLKEFIDLAIPRGGESLIERVCREASMPVLKHFRGNCHVYVDRAADPAMAVKILVNAKCQRPAVCNAAESLLVHADIASTFLPMAAAALTASSVELRGCERTIAYVPNVARATEGDFYAEYTDLILSIKVVDDLEAAVDHIAQYGSGHTEAIVTSDYRAAEQFAARVDSSAVMVNASTRFNDGFELGLGAEIGISTDKLHARGPCGLRELTSYKYVVYGDGHIRE
ncbi:MAG: glutamate-5-semialdehyde dehydrogenase [Gemmataceae bacterium]